MDAFMDKIAADNSDLFHSAVYEWIAEGMDYDDDPTPEQIAVVLLMEASTQDECVKTGDSDASYPIRLRSLAYDILDHYHPRPKI